MTKRNSVQQSNGRYYSAAAPFEPSQRGLPTRQKPAPQGLTVPDEGRDGGGSRSGAPSQSGSDASDQPSGPTVRSSMAMALHGQLGGTPSPHRARADALGDQSDVDDDESS